MALMLEIHKTDGTVTSMPLTGVRAKQAVQPGEQVRIVDSSTGDVPAGLNAARAGNALLVAGLPDGATLELSDFFLPREGEDAITLTLEGGETIVSPTADPMMVAQTPAPTAPPAPATPAATQADAAPPAGAEAAVASPGLKTTGIALGALGVIGVAAAAGGGGSDSPPPAPAPEPPPAPPPAGTTDTPVITGVTGLGSDTTLNAAEAAAGPITVSGTAEAGASVAVTWGSTVQTVTAGTDGTWSAAFTGAQIPAAEGSTSITAVATAAGEGASAAASTTVLIDRVAPAAPLFTVNGDGSITGTAEAGSSVQLNVPGAVTQPAPVTATGGNFTFPAGTVPNGVTGVTAVATDAAGNAGASGTGSLPPVTGTAGNDTLFGAGATSMDGGDGNDIIFGGFGASVANASFEFWNTSTPFSFEGGGFTVADLGWKPTFNNLPPGGVNPTFENRADINAEGTIYGRVEFKPLPNEGRVWETTLDTNSGGSGLQQNLNIVSGQAYTLNVGIVTSTIANGAAFQIVWGGSEVAGTGSNPGDPAAANGLPSANGAEQITGGTTVAYWNPALATWTSDGTTPLANQPQSSVSGDVTTFSFPLPAISANTANLALITFDEYGQATGFDVTKVSVSATGATAANVSIAGGAGDDTIFGQGGNDTLTGGTGADTFVYSMTEANGNDTITDFAVGTDIIRLINVTDAETSASLDPSDTGPPGTADSNTNLAFADFQVSGVQELTVTDDNGSVRIGFTTNQGGSGSVTLTGVAFGTAAGQYDSVEDVMGATNGLTSLITLTSDGI